MKALTGCRSPWRSGGSARKRSWEDVFPDLSFAYSSNLHFAYSVLSAHAREGRRAKFKSPPNVPNVFFSNLGASVFLSDAFTENSTAVGRVFLRGHVFKIFDSIVKSVSVFMIHLLPFRWAEKCHADQSMQGYFGPQSVLIKNGAFVSSARFAWGKNLRPSDSLVADQASNIPKGRYFINSFVSRNIFPDFFHSYPCKVRN